MTDNIPKYRPVSEKSAKNIEAEIEMGQGDYRRKTESDFKPKIELGPTGDMQKHTITEQKKCLSLD